MSENKNIAAFPAYSKYDMISNEGMDLLTYVSAKVLQGIITQNRAIVSTDEVAAECYDYAKAFLEERQKHI